MSAELRDLTDDGQPRHTTGADGHAGSGWERDCLTCKEMADKARAKHASTTRSQSLIVTVHEGGTRWGTTGGPDE